MDKKRKKLKKVVCKKSLRKSTYKTYAFTKGYVYYILEEDDRFITVEDNLKNGFEFARVEGNIFYHFDEYFDEKT